MQTILTLDGLTKKYGGLTAVDNLSFSIQKGNVYGLLGPNGSGKSTTLGLVLSVVNPTSGGFSWFGGRVSAHGALRKVGAIIERPNFYPYMTAGQNLELVCTIKGVDKGKIDQKLELVGLLERKHSKFKTFSLGMKQRLAIASALLNEPELLILDEPANGLDPQGIHQIRELIKKIADSGATILLASHLLDEVEKVCTHVVVLRRGKNLYNGPVDGIKAGHGYFTLDSDDNGKLAGVLKTHPDIGEIKTASGKVLAYLQNPVKPASLNRFLFEKDIVLDHLTHRKESLEELFLELTNS